MALDALFCLLFVGTLQPLFLALVILDFVGRGTLNLRGSVFGLFLKTQPVEANSTQATELDPKTFAARLGAVASSAAFVLFFAGYPAWSQGIAIGVAAFSLSDAIFKKCCGSGIYLRFLKPYFDKVEQGIVREFKETPAYKIYRSCFAWDFFRCSTSSAIF